MLGETGGADGTGGLRPGEIVVDLFAGGGGVGIGLARATGRPPDLAVNHCEVACAVYATNHGTAVINSRLEDVDPAAACAGRPVGILWASPDCTHHSRGRAGVPRRQDLRDLPWVVLRWVRAVRPRIVLVENVEELLTWGRLGPDGRPDPRDAGAEFRRFVAAHEAEGYSVGHRALTCADFGVPTTRRRLFVVMRRDGLPAAWPEPTHGRSAAPGAPPWRSSAEHVVDHALAGSSVFLGRAEGRALGLKRPLVRNTTDRIARGTLRYVVDDPAPFAVDGPGGERAYPFLTSFHGGRVGRSLREPMPTVTSNSYAKRPGGAPPMGVVRAVGVPPGRVEGDRAEGAARVAALLAPLRGGAAGPVVVGAGPEARALVDLTLRMVSADELFRAQGFPEGYATRRVRGPSGWIDLTQAERISLCGNAVPPRVPELLALANLRAAA